MALAAWGFAPMLLGADTAYSQLKLCALRDGPSGPCTCKGPDDAAGQFTVAPRSRCGVAKPAPVPAPAAAETKDPAPVTQQTAASPAAPSAEAQSGDPASKSTHAAEAGATLREIRARGKLICGVNGTLVGFSSRSASGDWQGLDVDFCRAVAAAALGDASKAEIVVVDIKERFDVLRSGKIDLLTRNTTWTMPRETELGLEFPGVLYYDGQSITAKLDAGLVSAQQLGGMKICVLAGTTSEKNLSYYYSVLGMGADIATYQTEDELLAAYEGDTCAAYSGDRSALFSDRLKFKDPSGHAILPEVISKEPLGPVVREGDAQWIKIVRWTLAGLINAEEVQLSQQGLKSNTAPSDDAQRLMEGAGAAGKAIGLEADWIKTVILAVGNYGEMFDRNLGGASPLGMERGLNALWKKGGILFAPPMW